MYLPWSTSSILISHWTKSAPVYTNQKSKSDQNHIYSERTQSAILYWLHHKTAGCVSNRSFEGCKNNCILLWTHLSNHFHFNTTCPFIRLGSFLYDTKHKNPQIYAKLTRNKDNDNRMLTALRTLLVAIRALYNTLISLLL